MRHSIDPHQNWLIDPGLARHSKVARRRLLESWPGVFRACLLELMPVEEVGAQFAEAIGRPTKELYSTCGLLLLMEFNNWTVEQAADAYMFDSRVQFALNLGHDQQTMSTRTLERYQKIFRDEKLAQELMVRVTTRLAELMELKVEELRLDSTHVFSNMARYGRTRLMVTAIHRFLVQLKRHESKKYHALPKDLRERYRKKGWKFAGGPKSSLTREQVAQDMYVLISLFENTRRITKRPTFQELVQVFFENCELAEGKVVVRAKPGLDRLQNPSDPGATLDPHKGPGYQVQTAETCSDENETQLIVSALPETACEHDQNAVEKVLDDLQCKEIVPSDLLADSAYGSDRNYCNCRERDIRLTAPVNQGTMKKGRVELHEFSWEGNCIKSCPIGKVPFKTRFDEEKGRGVAAFAASDCQACPRLENCQARLRGKNYSVYYDRRSLRIVERKLDMQSEKTQALYAKRSGVEANYSLGKRVCGLGRLRVRGRPAVFNAILLKITGLNILRATRDARIQQYVKKQLASKLYFVFGSRFRRLLSSLKRLHRPIGPTAALTTEAA